MRRRLWLSRRQPYVQIGRERLQLGEAELETAALRWGAARLREGTGLFERDYACFEGTESGKPILLWLISSDLKTVTEAQIERVTSERFQLTAENLLVLTSPYVSVASVLT